MTSWHKDVGVQSVSQLKKILKDALAHAGTNIDKHTQTCRGGPYVRTDSVITHKHLQVHALTRLLKTHLAVTTVGDR